jgi:peptide deformylase
VSLLPILIYGDARLQQVASPVAEVTDEIRKLAADMAETMYAAPGRGLAAPQIGRSVRMFVMDCHWKDGADRALLVMINPQIVKQSEVLGVYDEGCLSIPGIVVPVERPAEVTLRWQDLDGRGQQRDFEGFEAVCVQHEYDHLDGILTVDRIDPAARAAYEGDLLALSA